MKYYPVVERNFQVVENKSWNQNVLGAQEQWTCNFLTN